MSSLYDPAQQARNAGAAVIDDPIINGPYDEPSSYWDTIDWDKHEQHDPVRKPGRRPAGYFFNAKGQRGEGSLLEEQFIEMPAVNEIRRRVGEWRARGYPGVTPVTRKLLEHWASTQREQRLFFCQREAVETLIWLTESRPADRAGLTVETHDGTTVPLEKAHEAFLRYCCKMATGTGKTVCMAMVIAWQTLNKAQYPKDTRFTDAFLVVAPGLTVRNRLSVLKPGSDGNYYDVFELVPPSLAGNLGRARICFLHRQELSARDDIGKRGVQKLGKESDGAFANRLLKKELGSTSRIFVINDEGHHCYRPIEKSVEEKQAGPDAEAKRENQRAAQWITGLEAINRARNIMVCVDFSATPYYIHGSGYPAGVPFPWIVSDFGLLDAIESGLVKIPVMPVDDNHADGKSPAAYFHLWRWINDKLEAQDRYKSLGRGKGNPAKVAEKAQPACVTMIGNWKRTFDAWVAGGSQVPPCMIVVCQDTDVSAEVFKLLTRENWEFDHFVNKDGREVSFLFDSKALKDIEKVEEGETAKDREVRLRDILNTVGKEGMPGANVRFVSSVSMLTEGWDASNVTQIIGLRAFTSQLLCEQVVGRALRRRSYQVDPSMGLLEPEYAEIYGVPFQVIPVKVVKGGAKPPPPSRLVRALPERKAEYEITFPRVEGYLSEFRRRVVCDWENVPSIRVGSAREPTYVETGTLAGFMIGRPEALGGTAVHTRVPYYSVARIQSAIYSMAAEIVNRRVATSEEAYSLRRKMLFPQVLAIVRRYVGERIIFEDAPEEEIALTTWQSLIINALEPHLGEAGEDGAPLVLPRIERYRPEGSTRDVMFRTTRPVIPTTKSHISHVVLDSPLWEKVVADQLERCEDVQAYARNDHLEFTIPYANSEGVPSVHRPDFIVRLRSGLMIALEVKGHEREEDELKKAAGLKWARAVNNYYGMRKWAYAVVYDPDETVQVLAGLDSSVSLERFKTAPWKPVREGGAVDVDTSPTPLTELIAGGESATVEFKQSLEYVDANDARFRVVPEKQRQAKIAEARKAVVHSALKTICAFINSEGGTLLLGVSDAGGVVGLDGDFGMLGAKSNRDGFENKLWDLLKSRIHPIPTGEVKVGFEEVEGKTVCRVSVRRGGVPHYLDKRLYVRLGNSTEELAGPDLQDWLEKRGV